jgi:hypothetical protein
MLSNHNANNVSDIETAKQEIHHYVIFLFSTSHLAIKAELAVKRSLPEKARLIPLPPEVSAGCGMVLRCGVSDAEAVSACLEVANVTVDGVYSLTVQGSKREVCKLPQTLSN